MDVPDPFSSDFALPDFVALGAVGPPGERVFLFQIAQGRARVTIKVEKGQVAALAGFLRKMIKDSSSGGSGADVGGSFGGSPASQTGRGGSGADVGSTLGGSPASQTGGPGLESSGAGGVVSGALDSSRQDPDWIAGTIALAYDELENRIVLFMESLEHVGGGAQVDPNMPEEGIGSENEPNALGLGAEDLGGTGSIPVHRARLTLSLIEADRLADLADRLVAAGRPICPLCHGPMDPAGHRCPRSNGHGPPER
jgi:hypothetical protein